MQYYKKTSHTIYDCTYHIVWVTKHRYKVLIGDIGRRAKDLVQEICRDNGVEILRGKVASNHVHIYVCHCQLKRDHLFAPKRGLLSQKFLAHGNLTFLILSPITWSGNFNHFSMMS